MEAKKTMTIMMNTTTIKCYSELIEIPTFIGRYNYLRTNSQVGDETFGCHRYLNQALYQSREWRDFRRYIILRDGGCDLAHEDYYISDGVIILIHHINPITIDDILMRSSSIFDEENVISTILRTHNAIHYGDESLLNTEPVIRTPNDTCPWRR